MSDWTPKNRDDDNRGRDERDYFAYGRDNSRRENNWRDDHRSDRGYNSRDNYGHRDERGGHRFNQENKDFRNDNRSLDNNRGGSGVGKYDSSDNKSRNEERRGDNRWGGDGGSGGRFDRRDADGRGRVDQNDRNRDRFDDQRGNNFDRRGGRQDHELGSLGNRPQRFNDHDDRFSNNFRGRGGYNRNNRNENFYNFNNDNSNNFGSDFKNSRGFDQDQRNDYSGRSGDLGGRSNDNRSNFGRNDHHKYNTGGGGRGGARGGQNNFGQGNNRDVEEWGQDESGGFRGNGLKNERSNFEAPDSSNFGNSKRPFGGGNSSFGGDSSNFGGGSRNRGSSFGNSSFGGGGRDRGSDGNFGRDYSGRGGGRNERQYGCGESYSNRAEGRRSYANRYSEDDFFSGDGHGCEGKLEFHRGGNGLDREKKERAPVDWIPDERSVDELYNEDRNRDDNFQEDDYEKIEVQGGNNERTFKNWQNSGLEDILIDLLVDKCRFQSPRPIQAATIPHVLNGWDVVTKAETGSGKTLAFVLPIVDSILKITKDDKRRSQPLAVVLEPTRELAEQVFQNFKKFTDNTHISVVRNYGEMAKNAVINELRSVDIYVGTVGRLMDYQQKRLVDLSKMMFFVLDEADQMLKKNDMQQLEEIFAHRSFECTNGNRQTMLYSATMNKEASQIAQQLMRPNRTVKITTTGSRANRHIKQIFVPTFSTVEKNDELTRIFKDDDINKRKVKTLVFVGTKRATDALAITINQLVDAEAQSINGDRPQHLRTKVMDEFKKGTTSILIGTDVCARGLDIPDLDRVVLYDLPTKRQDIETSLNDFAHRIGRTGRNKIGTAYIFVDDTVTEDMAKGLVEMVKEVGQEPPEFLLAKAEGRSITFSGSGHSTLGDSGEEGRKNNFESFGGGFGSSGGFGNTNGEGFGGFNGGGFSELLKDKKEPVSTVEHEYKATGIGSTGFGTSFETNEKKENNRDDNFSREDHNSKDISTSSEKGEVEDKESGGFGTGYKPESPSLTKEDSCDY